MAYSGDENPLKVTYQGDNEACDEALGIAQQFWNGQASFARRQGLERYTKIQDLAGGGNMTAQFGPGANRELIINKGGETYLEVAEDARISLDMPEKLKGLRDNAMLYVGPLSALETETKSPYVGTGYESYVYPHPNLDQRIGWAQWDANGQDYTYPNPRIMVHAAVNPLLVSVVDKTTLQPIAIPMEGGNDMFSIDYTHVSGGNLGAPPLYRDLSDISPFLARWGQMTPLSRMNTTGWPPNSDTNPFFLQPTLNNAMFAEQYGFEPGTSTPGSLLWQSQYAARAALGPGMMTKYLDEDMIRPGIDGGASGTYAWLFPSFHGDDGNGEVPKYFDTDTYMSNYTAASAPSPDNITVDLSFMGQKIQSMPTQITYLYNTNPNSLYDTLLQG